MPELLNTTHVVSKFWLQRRKSTQCHKQRESLYPWEMGRWAVCLAPCPVWPAAAPVSPTWYSALGFWWLPTPFVLSHCRTGDEDKGVIDFFFWKKKEYFAVEKIFQELDWNFSQLMWASSVEGLLLGARQWGMPYKALLCLGWVTAIWYSQTYLPQPHNTLPR